MSDFDVMGLLEDIIGPEKAMELAENLAGMSIYIPKRVLTNRKKELLVRDYAAGKGYRELARRYGYTERTVRRILSRGMRTPRLKDDRQRELFK